MLDESTRVTILRLHEAVPGTRILSAGADRLVRIWSDLESLTPS